MSVTLGVVMDPIESIIPYKDSTLAMLLAAQRRNWTVIYFTIDSLFSVDGVAMGLGHTLVVKDQKQDWFEKGPATEYLLGDIDVILMRKDPPVDSQYLYATHLLEIAESAGSLVVN